MPVPFAPLPPALDLLSFPTRRSSDLVADEDLDAELVLEGADLLRYPRLGRVQGLGRFGHVQVPARDFGEAAELLRSEEHTSELQSPCKLVCRLLLEKKTVRASCASG